MFLPRRIPAPRWARGRGRAAAVPAAAGRPVPPPQRTAEPSSAVSPPPLPVDPIAAAVEGWRRALAGSHASDTLLARGPEATASWLDLTQSHPSGLAQLFAARPTRLSSLFREPAAHAGARRQARAIRAAALLLAAQRGDPRLLPRGRDGELAPGARPGRRGRAHRAARPRAGRPARLRGEPARRRSRGLRPRPRRRRRHQPRAAAGAVGDVRRRVGRRRTSRRSPTARRASTRGRCTRGSRSAAPPCRASGSSARWCSPPSAPARARCSPTWTPPSPRSPRIRCCRRRRRRPRRSPSSCRTTRPGTATRRPPT